MSLIPALNLNETLADYLFLIVLRHFDAPLAPLTGVTPFFIDRETKLGVSYRKFIGLEQEYLTQIQELISE